MFEVLATGNWAIDQIRVRSGGAARKIVPAVEAIIEAEWDRMRQRPGVKLFDGPMMRLASFHASCDLFELELSETSYKPFAATHMARPDLIQLYGREVMADPLGLSTLVVTTDGCLLMGWRQESLAFYGGRVHPFAGAMEPGDAGPIHAAMRELQEELSLDREAAGEVRCVGIVEEHRLWMRELICVADCRKSKAELEAVLDVDEHHATWSVRATADDVAESLKTDRAPTPVGRAALLLWGLRQFGQAWFDANHLVAQREL